MLLGLPPGGCLLGDLGPNTLAPARTYPFLMVGLVVQMTVPISQLRGQKLKEEGPSSGNGRARLQTQVVWPQM